MGGHVNLSHIIDDHDADSPALIAHGRTTTYGQLHDQVARFRGGLASLGVGDGDRVGDVRLARLAGLALVRDGAEFIGLEDLRDLLFRQVGL